VASSGLTGEPDRLPAPQRAEGILTFQVTGERSVPWQTYDALRQGLKAFKKAAQRHAPKAGVVWAVLPAGTEPLPRNLSLRLSLPQGTRPIPLGAGQTFDVPIVDPYDDTVELVVNVRASRLRLGYDVRSPGLPAGEMRMGDLRAWCSMYWVLEREQAERYKDQLRRVPEPCFHWHIVWWFSAPRGLSDPVGLLVDGDTTVPLLKRGTREFLVPLNERKWSDEARIRYIERSALLGRTVD
jgi:hypothetical protein